MFTNVFSSWGKKRHIAKASSGKDILRNPSINKGQSFSDSERNALGLVGLLPVGQLTDDTQVEREMLMLRKKSSPIEKYIHMMHLLDRNEGLFYRILTQNITELMPIVYTPTVGQACQEYGEIWSNPKGLYVSLKDKGRVQSLVDNWPSDDVRVIVFTDGERILGLGDLGVNGMGIPVGKLQLYSACAGIHPSQCLPVTIDVGTNTEKYLNDKFYLGLRQRRTRGKEFEDLVEEFMSAAVTRFGRSVILQFEDFGNSTAFHLLNTTRDRYTTFNDDIQGTAAVSLAGIMASLHVTSKLPNGAKKLRDHVFVFLGAGEAGTGIANLIAHAIVEESIVDAASDEDAMSIEEARSNIWLVDSQGLVCKQRKDKLAHHKLDFAHNVTEDHVSHLADTEHAVDDLNIKTLDQAVRALRATAIIGVSATPNTFTQTVCEHLAENCSMPLIFALSNPTSHCECSAEQAYKWTKGNCLFASGSPFGKVQVTYPDGSVRTMEPGQGNNAYIFPGLGLGLLASEALSVPDELLYVSAQTLAEQVTESDFARGSLYPPLESIRDVSAKIAVKVADRAIHLGVSSMKKKPENMDTYVRSLMNSEVNGAKL